MQELAIHMLNLHKVVGEPWSRELERTVSSAVQINYPKVSELSPGFCDRIRLWRQIFLQSTGLLNAWNHTKWRSKKEPATKISGSPARARPWCKYWWVLEYATGEKLQRSQWNKLLSWNKIMPCATWASSRLEIIFVSIHTEKCKYSISIQDPYIPTSYTHSKSSGDPVTRQGVCREAHPSHMVRALKCKSTSSFSIK